MNLIEFISGYCETFIIKKYIYVHPDQIDCIESLVNSIS